MSADTKNVLSATGVTVSALVSDEDWWCWACVGKGLDEGWSQG